MAITAKKPAAAAKLRPVTKRGAITLLIGTRKGLFQLKSDAARKTWTLKGPEFLGQVIHHAVADPRDTKTMLAAVNSGHLGPTIFRSMDGGKSWKEASKPPAFPKKEEGGRKIDHNFWLAPGHASEKGTWYLGTSPVGLFHSKDGGDTWEPVSGLNDHPMYDQWFPKEFSPPEGSTLHSISIDPRDPKHMLFGASVAGVFESFDKGATWKPLNKGQQSDFLPSSDVEYGFDPHCMAMHPLDPDIFYQQNHCGIYRMDRKEALWHRVGDNMPKRVRDIGFVVSLHRRNPAVAWVFPMDGTEAWPRTSPHGEPAVYETRDHGKTWKPLRKGMPQQQAWWTVKRQCLCSDAHDPVGIYLGTTSGEVWASVNEGKSWKCVARHLPHIYSVEVVGVAR